MSNNQSPSPILAPATIGILGSGQLGRMLAVAARQMGYRVHVYSPGKNTPTGQIADREFTADYLDLEQVREFAQSVDVVTYEFENVPLATARAAAEFVPVRPGPLALEVAQNRRREKEFMAGHGLPVAPFAPVESWDDLEAAVATIGLPAVLKTAESGYDGKGQFRIDESGQLATAWEAIQEQPAVLEGFISFDREVSVVGARGIDGSFAHYGVIENDHHRHILDVSRSPARLPEEVMNRAIELAKIVLTELDVVGVLCVEFFVTDDGGLVINEIAPRPHNSGHLTIESHVTGQFEQQLRAVCGLSLGSTEQLKPAAMVNILGDLWPPEGQPDWAAVANQNQVKIHLYGKEEARVGRKMGHLTVLADSVDEAAAVALAAREALQN